MTANAAEVRDTRRVRISKQEKGEREEKVREGENEVRAEQMEIESDIWHV